MSGVGQNNWGGMAFTMVDALDTLWLMDMKQEFQEARDYIDQHLHVKSVNQQVNQLSEGRGERRSGAIARRGASGRRRPPLHAACRRTSLSNGLQPRSDGCP